MDTAHARSTGTDHGIPANAARFILARGDLKGLGFGGLRNGRNGDSGSLCSPQSDPFIDSKQDPENAHNSAGRKTCQEDESVNGKGQVDHEFFL